MRFSVVWCWRRGLIRYYLATENYAGSQLHVKTATNFFSNLETKENEQKKNPNVPTSEAAASSKQPDY